MNRLPVNRAGYWVLSSNGYSDTRADYRYVKLRRDVVPTDYGYLDNPSEHVFHGDRTPWTEHDAYPDWVVSFGPRSGVRWERA